MLVADEEERLKIVTVASNAHKRTRKAPFTVVLRAQNNRTVQLNSKSDANFVRRADAMMVAIDKKLEERTKAS